MKISAEKLAEAIEVRKELVEAKREVAKEIEINGLLKDLEESYKARNTVADREINTWKAIMLFNKKIYKCKTMQEVKFYTDLFFSMLSDIKEA